jgi:hypothetical protein
MILIPRNKLSTGTSSPSDAARAMRRFIPRGAGEADTGPVLVQNRTRRYGKTDIRGS